MSIQMPPAQDLYNVLNQHYESQYKELHQRYTSLPQMLNFFSTSVTNKHSEKSIAGIKSKVADIAGELQDLVIAGEKIKILGNLLNQGILYLKRDPLSQERTLTNNLSHLNPNFIVRCTQLFDQNANNVQVLSEAQGKVKALEEQYQEKLQVEVLPRWSEFAEKFGTPIQKEDSNPLDRRNSTEEASKIQVANAFSGLFNVATSAVSNLATGIFSVVISGPKNNFEPKNYLAPDKVKPLPSMEELTAFFNTHRPQILTESPLVACSEVSVDPSKNLTCTIVYQKLHALCTANYKNLNKKWLETGELSTRLDKVRQEARQKTGDSDTLKKFGGELQPGFTEIGLQAAQYKVDLKAITALELYLKLGVDYLTLLPISEEDKKTIEILDGKFWTSITQAQAEQVEQLATLKKYLENVSELKKNMQDSCSLIEKMYHSHRYQITNLGEGGLAALGPKQLCKVRGSWLNNPTDPKLPEPLNPQVQLKNFDSKDMELLSTLDPENCLIAILNRVRTFPFNENDDDIAVNESEQKFKEETLLGEVSESSEDIEDEFTDEDLQGAINSLIIHSDENSGNNLGDESPAQLLSDFINPANSTDNKHHPVDELEDESDTDTPKIFEKLAEQDASGLKNVLQDDPMPDLVEPDAPIKEGNASVSKELRNSHPPLEFQCTVQNAVNLADQPIDTRSPPLVSGAMRQIKHNPFKRNGGMQTGGR